MCCNSTFWQENFVADVLCVWHGTIASEMGNHWLYMCLTFVMCIGAREIFVQQQQQW